MAYIKNLFFLITFIGSFALISTRSTELFGLGLFLAVNFVYCIFVGMDAINALDNAGLSYLLIFTLIIVIVFSFVSSILFAITMSKLQRKFTDKNKILRLGDSETRDLEKAEIIFMTVTVMSWVIAFQAFQTSDHVYSGMYSVATTMLYGSEMNWIRIIFGIATIGIGCAIYGQLYRARIPVDNGKGIKCDPDDDTKTEKGVSMTLFKLEFIKAFWFLVVFVFLRLSKPFIMTNRFMFQKSWGFNWRATNFEPHFSNKTIPAKIYWLFDLIPIPMWPGFNFNIFYDWITWIFGISALVFTSYTIRNLEELKMHDCMKSKTHIRELTIAFMFFLICLYTVNVMTAYQFTGLVYNIIKWIVPPAAIGLSAYLVYLTNYMTRISTHEILE